MEVGGTPLVTPVTRRTLAGALKPQHFALFLDSRIAPEPKLWIPGVYPVHSIINQGLPPSWLFSASLAPALEGLVSGFHGPDPGAPSSAIRPRAPVLLSTQK